VTGALSQSSTAGVITSVASIFTVLGIIMAMIVGIYQIRRLRVETNGKLEVIHTLVNSTLTAEIESNLDASRRELTTLNELIDELHANEHKIAPETIAARAACVAKIGTLTQKMADRLKAAEAVLAQEAQVNPIT
jgi:hypothetical protein